MYRTFREMGDFRNRCIWPVDFWGLYSRLETNDDDYNELLYERVETGLEDWIKRNTKEHVYYIGDLRFEFEDQDERDRFNEENDDPMAFKLTYA